MSLNWLDRIGESNPQLFRELKGRLQNRNIAIAVALSLLGQLSLFLYGELRLSPSQQIYSEEHWQPKYNFLQLFTSLSFLISFALLVLGSYLLISDLAREERRATLNFLRLTPQSPQSILIGKMLGVPILLYLAVLLAVPLHLWLGLSAEIPLVKILGFYSVLVASCAFFYSAALLFSLVSSWFSGLQAWLGSGAVLAFLFITNNKGINHSPADWLNLFCPSVILRYLVNRTESVYEYYQNFSVSHIDTQQWEWFNLPLSNAFGSAVIFMLFNYAIGTYWIWQALNRRFHNPNASLISKGKSYLLTACMAQVSLGFALPSWKDWEQGYSLQLFDNFLSLVSLNLLLLVSLIATLSPHRQALLDWTRYRREKASALIQDLLWKDKSPAVVAIAINLAIACIPLATWILIWPLGASDYSTIQLLSGLVLTLNLVLTYATLTQLMLLMKSPLRAVWAAGTVVAANLLPPLILSLLPISPENHWGSLWLLSTSPWDALKYTSPTLVVQVILFEWSILGVLSWQLTRKLQRAGESATKALLAGRPALPN
jgi:hypothetical protein